MPSPTAADVPGISERKRGFYRRLIGWILNPDHFHFKLLAGTTAGVLAFVVLAIACLVVTFGKQKREDRRSYRIEVMRLSSVVENDVAAIENAYRGHLLARDGGYMASLTRLDATFLKHCDELSRLVGDNADQRKRVLKMRENIQSWFSHNSLSNSQTAEAGSNQVEIKALLNASAIDQAHEVLQTILREEQIQLSQDMGEQEWVIQSTQILNFVPRMERAVYDMQKEKRGYILTGDPVFIDSYKRAVSDFYTFQGYLSVLVANEPERVAQLKHIRDDLEVWIAQGADPDIEAKRNGETLSDRAHVDRNDGLVNNVRRAMEQFEKEQDDVYRIRLGAASRQRIMTLYGVDLFCLLAAGLMIASGSYNFVLYRRQLKKLEGADTRIRCVVDHILDGMVTIDETGAVCSMNPAAQRMFGDGGNEFVGVDFTTLIPKYFERELDDAPLPCDWSQLARRTGGTTLALAKTHTNGTFPAELSLAEITVEQQKLSVAMIRDITERKRFEEELAAEKKSLAVTLASIGDGVITTDLNGRVVICNAAGEAMTGWTASEAVGQPLRAVLAISADVTAQKRSGSTGYRSEAEAILLSTPERATLTSRNGIERLVEQAASPVRDAKNQICGVVVVFRDITERQRDEAERRKGEALDQLGLLAGGIAHDFNNLLTEIIGNISLISMLLPPNEDVTRRLEDAKNASLRARDLAQQLLTFARGGAPIKQTASIADLVQETVSFSLRGSHSRAEITIEPDLWAAEFDPGQISQVIANLVVNADQAMPNGGTLHVKCDNFSHTANPEPATLDLPAGDYIRIRLRDEGTGIPESYLKRIFDPYFTTKAKGSGLGLATTYSVIKNHNGLITVESELHCGSTFSVYLPAARHQPLATEPVALTNEPMKGSGRVLVVDDEEAIRILVDFTLTRLGYEVCPAPTALHGIELYREALITGHRFDLVILDLTLPGGMGGKEALKKLLEIDPMVNAVVSSGYATDATMSRYEDFGFRGMIAKPYQAAELGRKVHALIASNDPKSGSTYQLQHAC
ncbi:MAG: CHASE3 domain-containing protein [Chthoniobacterales bacterium]